MFEASEMLNDHPYVAFTFTKITRIHWFKFRIDMAELGHILQPYRQSQTKHVTQEAKFSHSSVNRFQIGMNTLGRMLSNKIQQSKALQK